MHDSNDMPNDPKLQELQKYCYIDWYIWHNIYWKLLDARDESIPTAITTVLSHLAEIMPYIHSTAKDFIANNPPMQSKKEYRQSLDQCSLGWSPFWDALNAAQYTQVCVDEKWLNEFWNDVEEHNWCPPSVRDGRFDNIDWPKW
jgi:hypothetical protein